MFISHSVNNIYNLLADDVLSCINRLMEHHCPNGNLSINFTIENKNTLFGGVDKIEVIGIDTINQVLILKDTPGLNDECYYPKLGMPYIGQILHALETHYKVA